MALTRKLVVFETASGWDNEMASYEEVVRPYMRQRLFDQFMEELRRVQTVLCDRKEGQPFLFMILLETADMTNFTVEIEAEFTEGSLQALRTILRYVQARVQDLELVKVLTIVE